MMKSGENDETSKADFMNTYKVNPCIDRILAILDEMEKDYPAQVNVLKKLIPKYFDEIDPTIISKCSKIDELHPIIFAILSNSGNIFRSFLEMIPPEDILEFRSYICQDISTAMGKYGNIRHYELLLKQYKKHFEKYLNSTNNTYDMLSEILKWVHDKKIVELIISEMPYAPVISLMVRYGHESLILPLHRKGVIKKEEFTGERYSVFTERNANKYQDHEAYLLCDIFWRLREIFASSTILSEKEKTQVDNLVKLIEVLVIKIGINIFGALHECLILNLLEDLRGKILSCKDKGRQKLGSESFASIIKMLLKHKDFEELRQPMIDWAEENKCDQEIIGLLKSKNIYERPDQAVNYSIT